MITHYSGSVQSIKVNAIFSRDRPKIFRILDLENRKKFQAVVFWEKFRQKVLVEDFYQQSGKCG